MTIDEINKLPILNVNGYVMLREVSFQNDTLFKRVYTEQDDLTPISKNGEKGPCIKVITEEFIPI